MVYTMGLLRRVVEIEAACIEGRIDRATANVGVRRALSTIEVDVATVQVDRTSALPLIDASRLPATEDRVDDTTPVVTPLATFPEGRLPDAVDHDAVRDIVGADPPLVARIRVVEEAHLFHHLRPGVTSLQRQPAGETTLQAELAGVIDSPPVVTLRRDTGEFREGAQQLPPRRR